MNALNITGYGLFKRSFRVHIYPLVPRIILYVCESEASYYLNDQLYGNQICEHSKGTSI